MNPFLSRVGSASEFTAMVRLGCVCFAALLNVWAIMPVHADVLLRIRETSVHAESKEIPTGYSLNIYIGKDRARFDWPARSRVIQLDKKVLYLLNHFDKTYHRIPLPPDSKDYVESEVWGQPQAVLSKIFKKESARLSPAGETQTIGPWKATKFECEVHDEFGNKVSESTLWQSTELEIDLTAFKELRRNYALAGDHGEAQWIDQILALEGFGVLEEWTEYRQAGTFTTTRRLESITEEEVSVDFYEPPQDYELTPFYRTLFVSLDELR